MRWAIILAAVAVASCEGYQAERHYTWLKENGGSPQELCTAAREVVNAYANDRNGDEYKSWKGTAAMDCVRASLYR